MNPTREWCGLCKLLSVSSSYFFGKHDFCFNVLGFHKEREREREREKRMYELDFVCVFTLFRLPLHVSQKNKKEATII